ncbi:MAG: cytochrome c [Bacteroidota bacterium]|nr:cytochrome c [Bacteroidota bacterium]
MKKTTYTLLAFGTIAFAVSALFGSCAKDNADSPGYEFMPDLYRSPSTETNGINYWTDSILVNGKWVANDSVHMGNMLPPEGTIPVGFTPFPYENTAQGDSLAVLYWNTPLTHSTAMEEEGKVLYELFCVYCHGPKGEADGKLVVDEKFAATPPKYSTLFQQGKTSDGHIYHVITYGKGNMGSHASQLSPTERWKVVAYVERLARGGSSWDEFLKAAPTPASDSIKNLPAVPVAAGNPTPNK